VRKLCRFVRLVFAAECLTLCSLYSCNCHWDFHDDDNDHHPHHQDTTTTADLSGGMKSEAEAPAFLVSFG
jgi:hypothetical protein